MKRRATRLGRCGALLSACLLGACSTVQDFSPMHAFDMPSPTEKGYAALAANDNPTAVTWFTVALKDKPDDPYLTLDLAAAYQRLGRFDDARKLYQVLVDTATGVVPKTVDDAKLQGRDLAQIAAADLAICTGCAMPDQALDGYRKFAAGEFAGAAESLEAAFAAKPDVYLQLDLGATDRRLGRTDEARVHYQAVADAAKTLQDAADKAKEPKDAAEKPKDAAATAERPKDAADKVATAKKDGASATPHPKTLLEIAQADLAALGK